MKTKIIPILLFIFFLSSTNILAQTVWKKYGKQPVLKRDTILAHLPNDIYAISDPFVLKEKQTYKMWYTCGGLNFPTDTLLRSRICYCESTDGINWKKDSANPVLDVSYNGLWDSLGVETPFIVVDSLAPVNQRYKMWYAGQYFNSYRYEIGYAFSPDGILWTKHSTPVLRVGGPLDWDGGFLEGPSVIIDNGVYKMWYSGYNLNTGKTNTGYATSTDGINWVKYINNPVITVSTTGKWDSFSVQDPHVIKLDTLYHMWFGGLSQDSIYGQEVGYASSTDGIHWTKSSLNPILKKGKAGSWDANTASFPAVILDDESWKMWYTGKDVDPLPLNSSDYFWEIGYAYSAPTGIFEFSNKKNIDFFIFPRPAKEILHIKFEQNIKQGEYFIYDLLARKRMSGTIRNLKAFSIDLHNLESGAYLLIITNGIHKKTVRFIHLNTF